MAVMRVMKVMVLTVERAELVDSLDNPANLAEEVAIPAGRATAGMSTAAILPTTAVEGTTRGGGAAGQSHRSVQSKTALGGASASHRPSQNRGLQCGNPSHIGPSNVDGGSASYRTSQIRTLQGGDPSHVSPSASTRLHQPSASEEFSYPFPLRYKAVALYNEKHPNSQATVPSYEVMASKFWSVSLPEGLLKAHSSIFDNFDIARDPNVTVEKWFRERYICTFVLLHALRRRMERQYDLSPPSDEELVEMDNWVAGHAQHLHMLLEDVSRV
ncbi:hypothetical protein K470DRAFT_274263 [Piedraia hortae CBS 480.64]|uniref:Uncharacterized protein n=1 Tax=Piedraia hortae CBS 480.64 TaxID=1314780 RepID=A0A6A7CAZ0_9PEZI|nr:hypothetical protein K470DRAFT_274263 [Piedraia hortae CBS 480.64]